MLTVNTIALAAIIQSAFLICLLLFNRKGNRQASVLLICLIGLLTISLWNTYVWNAGLAVYWKLINYEVWVTAFLWGPVLYLYVGTMTGQITLNRALVSRHCAIALGLFVAQLPLYLAKANDWILPAYLTGLHRFIVLALYIQLALYLYACLQVLKAYSSTVKDYYSNIEKINLAWLKRLIVMFAVLIAFDMVTTVPAFILQDEYRYLAALVVAEATTIYLIGYFSLSQPEVLFPSTNVPERESKKPKYSGSPLDRSLSTELSSRLDAIMQDSKVFQKNDLRLANLAEIVGVSPHHLSQLINEHCQSNFYDYVNKYRVEFAAKALMENSRGNITDIAFESGFNNRASFNSSFKKHTGMTPSQYKRQYQPQIIDSSL